MSVNLPSGLAISPDHFTQDVKVEGLDPKTASDFNDLANTLQEEESIKLNNGDLLTKVQLYQKCIELDPNFAAAYYGLGIMIRASSSVIVNGQLMTTRDVFIKCIELDPHMASAYYYLAETLSSRETVYLPYCGPITKIQLYVKCIDLDPSFAPAYSRLVLLLGPRESISLFGKVMYRTELMAECDKICYATLKKESASREKFLNAVDPHRRVIIEGALQSIALYPNEAGAYYELAINIPSGGSIDLWDGTQQNQAELLRKAIELDPSAGIPYYQLSKALSGNDTVLIAGKTYTQQDLLLTCIDHDSTFALAYRDLANTLQNGSSIRLSNGIVFVKEELLQKADSLTK